jgi:hypothetical protein
MCTLYENEELIYICDADTVGGCNNCIYAGEFEGDSNLEYESNLVLSYKSCKRLYLGAKMSDFVGLPGITVVHDYLGTTNVGVDMFGVILDIKVGHDNGIITSIKLY